MAFAGFDTTKVKVIMTQKNMPHRIYDIVCDFYGMDKKAVLSKNRRKNLAMCRHITAYFLRRYTNMNLKEVGAFLGNRDHTTILNSVKQMKGWMQTDESLSRDIDAIRSLI